MSGKIITASDLGLHCLPMSHLWDVRHKWANVFDQADRGSVFGFRVLWLQIAIEPFVFTLFHRSGFELYVLQCDESQMRQATPVRTEYMFVILSCIRI